MTEMTVFVCDGCEKVNGFPWNMITIEKIFVGRMNTYQVEGDDPIKREDVYENLHFCCKECLNKWIDEHFEENLILRKSNKEDVNRG